MNRYIGICLFFLAPLVASSQDCKIHISGYVKDASTAEPISYASIYVKELQTGQVVDSKGFFRLEDLCEGSYHLIISHIGCETQEVFIRLSTDTILQLVLYHNSHLLHEVAIVSEGLSQSTQESESLSSVRIAESANENFAKMIEELSGVSSIKNGAGIMNPMVQGLYGNRLTIMNNGVAQNGQQWGSDHSPEIDPMVAKQIRVIKGVGALEYQGNSLGSVVLMEPQKIGKDPHLHGEARYYLESNGLGNGLNLELQQYTKLFAWRFVGSLKKRGDLKSADYYLRNTGSQEGNAALQLERSWSNKWSSDLYFSSFNSEYGLLRGSQIGSITDLTTALERDVPFYTEEDFSFDINSPRQQVNHQILKFHTRFQANKKHWFNLSYARQSNSRKEFDVRRGGRSELPSLSLKQISNFLEAKYEGYVAGDWKLKAGVQINQTDNLNVPETGILPLIPDFISYEYGAFGIGSRSFRKTHLEFGARYDIESRNVAAISISQPREIFRYKNDYHNFSALAGISQNVSKALKVTYNIGYASRNPEVNELYSYGLHQGVSGIEEGDPNLGPELSLKNTLSIKSHLKNKVFVEGLFYYQNIENYIFLEPQDEVRLTIRGAFPVFTYNQTDANIMGFDLRTKFQATDELGLLAKYSFLHGRDVARKIPLVYMPANNLDAALDYQISKFVGFQNINMEVNYRFVFEQNNLNPNQDFVAPPPAYSLIGLKLSAEKQLHKLRLKMHLRAENLLNVSYRDYLNRQRYFADDQGVNLIVGLNVAF